MNRSTNMVISQDGHALSLFRYIATACAVHIEDCEGWPAVMAQWQSTCGVHIEHCEGWPDVVGQWQSTSCAVRIEDCEGCMVVVRLSWLSGRVPPVQYV